MTLTTIIGMAIATLVAVGLLWGLTRKQSVFTLVRFKLEDYLSRQGDDPDRVAPSRLRFIVTRILTRMGLQLVRAQRLKGNGVTRLLAVGKGSYRDSHHVVYVASQPRGDKVRPELVDALLEDVQSSGASSGMLVTPYHIDRAAMANANEPIVLIDGLALKELVAHHLPHLESEIASYRMVGTKTVSATPQAWAV